MSKTPHRAGLHNRAIPLACTSPSVTCAGREATAVQSGAPGSESAALSTLVTADSWKPPDRPWSRRAGITAKTCRAPNSDVGPERVHAALPSPELTGESLRQEALERITLASSGRVHRHVLRGGTEPSWQELGAQEDDESLSG